MKINWFSLLATILVFHSQTFVAEGSSGLGGGCETSDNLCLWRTMTLLRIVKAIGVKYFCWNPNVNEFMYKVHAAESS